MLLQRICVLQGLLCLPLLACTADKDDDTTDTNPATSSASAGDSTTTGGSDETGPVTTADAGTSTTTTADPTTTDPTTGDESTGGVVTTGEDTTGAVGTTGDDTTGDGTTGGGTTTGGPAGLSWAMDVHPVVIANSCGCHANGSGGLTMTNAMDSYTALVGVESWQSLLDRVKPGDPDNSYLVHKLNGTQESVGGSGISMPLGGAKLSKEKLDLVAQWISDGAQP